MPYQYKTRSNLLESSELKKTEPRVSGLRFFIEVAWPLSCCNYTLAVVVHTGAQLLYVLDDGGSGNVGRMLGIDGDIGHGGDDGGEDDVPVLGGILVQGNFDALEDFDLLGQGVEGGLETQGGLATQLVAALKLEHYDMLDHCF